MNIEEKKADFMRRFKASSERKAEYIAQIIIIYKNMQTTNHNV